VSRGFTGSAKSSSLTVRPGEVVRPFVPGSDGAPPGRVRASGRAAKPLVKLSGSIRDRPFVGFGPARQHGKRGKRAAAGRRHRQRNAKVSVRNAATRATSRMREDAGERTSSCPPSIDAGAQGRCQSRSAAVSRFDRLVCLREKARGAGSCPGIDTKFQERPMPVLDRGSIIGAGGLLLPRPSASAFLDGRPRGGALPPGSAEEIPSRRPRLPLPNSRSSRARFKGIRPDGGPRMARLPATTFTPFPDPRDSGRG